VGCFGVRDYLSHHENSFTPRAAVFCVNASLLYILGTDANIIDNVLQSRCLVMMIGMMIVVMMIGMMIVTVGTHGCMWVVSPPVQGHETLKTLSADMGG
jgi:ABC-type enterochelin transport system permease subunit